MTAREAVVAALMVWLIGAVIGWCAGWAGRGDQNRAWHRNLVRQLADARDQQAEVLDQLDHARAQLDEAHARWEPPATPAVVHVHLPASLPWAGHQPVAIGTTPALRAAPVLPAGEVEP